MPLTPSRLSDFPYVRLSLTCVLCPRRVEYRLARLAARFGPETELGEVIYQLSIDCPYQRPQWRRPPRKYEVRCGVRLLDVEAGNAPPPDLPPEARRDALIVVQGGKPPEGPQ